MNTKDEIQKTLVDCKYHNGIVSLLFWQLILVVVQIAWVKMDLKKLMFGRVRLVVSEL
jgi:hypothetical protein